MYGTYINIRGYLSTSAIPAPEAPATVIGPQAPAGSLPATSYGKHKSGASLVGMEVYKVIQNSSPISALHEYCKKCET